MRIPNVEASVNVEAMGWINLLREPLEVLEVKASGQPRCVSQPVPQHETGR